MNYRGQRCYRILHGTYDHWNTAEAARTTLPAVYLNQESPALIVRVKKLQR